MFEDGFEGSFEVYLRTASNEQKRLSPFLTFGVLKPSLKRSLIRKNADDMHVVTLFQFGGHKQVEFSNVQFLRYVTYQEIVIFRFLFINGRNPILKRVKVYSNIQSMYMNNK